ncbi:MAG: RluA family pseudouridine synthase [Rhizobiales bacterium]|jgi:23S rRNA pseudouridine955/2504/2580 synthase|nr:RluA family pseudouridine synthase [Hyphomicrobiales bacterium]
MPVQTRKVKPDEEGMRLDRWFKAHFPDLTFAHLQKLLRTGQVRVDGGRAKTNTRLEPGMAVRVPPLTRSEKEETSGTGTEASRVGTSARAPSKMGDARSDAAFLKSITLYEDREVMVLNKPFGLAVQGGSGTTRHIDGLLEALRGRDGQKPRLVHRIDKDTCGILLIAKTRLAAATLAKTFRSRSARKIYWALVAGVPKPRQGRISTYLAKGAGEGGELMRVAKHGEDEASHAVTYYAVVEQAAQKVSWISLKPVTGRTHQLRAHTAHINHPIVGDPKYFSIENWEFPGGMQNRLHLLARRLVIPHPKGEGVIDVTAPLPQHMQQSWNLLGFDAKSYDPIVDAPEE